MNSWRRVVAGLFVAGMVLACLFADSLLLAADDWPLVVDVESQPLKADVRRVVQALQLMGAPMSEERQARFDAAVAEADSVAAVRAIQETLDPLCLAAVTINPESRVSVVAGPAVRELMQQGWRVFLIKVHNEGGGTAPLRVSSPNALPMQHRSTAAKRATVSISPAELENRWLDVQLTTRQPLDERLSGLLLQYRVIELYSRDAGRREAQLAFDVGQGTQDLGFRNEINLLFRCLPAVEVTLEVLDIDGKPTTGQFTFRDEQGRVYPALSRRLAPDMFFHEQVYRHSGESVWLPPGTYQATCTRGPEYLVATRAIEVPDAPSHRETFQLQRWIRMTDFGWYSGDHHVHAAGCKHYEAPTEGVQPEDMMRHILGEDLNVGCVLTWGPCWYYQKQFFQGDAHPLSTPRHLMRYDVEVSGFPSSHAGHLCLLRLTEDDYPGASLVEEWPSWTLPILQWGQRQGGVVGYSHSGWGLQIDDTRLPSLKMPRFDGIGANEYIVTVTHGASDFISAVDTPFVWELNIWYHTLNCGYTTRISGETDFPCIYGERVGLGRAYVQLAPDAPLQYDSWVHGIRDGRSYCTDGHSHLFDLTVGGLGVGQPGVDDRASVLAAKSGDKLRVAARAAAWLGPTPRDDVRNRPLDQKPYWNVERARIDDTRTVPVELVVNGQVVDRRVVPADGSIADVEFDFVPERSCWVALRIFAACHTNPVFVEVDGQPIRASRASAQWCLDAVDVCWNSKQAAIRESERAAAAAAYEHARAAYRRILAETPADER